MYRIGGSRRRQDASLAGGAVGIPLFCCRSSNLQQLSWAGTVSGGQFDWGGRLLKSNGGVQRFTQHGRKSCSECKRINEPNCETDGSSSNESWS